MFGKGTVSPAEQSDFMMSRRYDNNVIWYYLPCLETKMQVNLINLSKSKIWCQLDATPIAQVVNFFMMHAD